MNNLSRLLLSVTLVLSVCAPAAAEWSSKMQGGGAVTVNPDTRRATVTKDGVSSQLWDGAHRMEDGSVLIVNHGEVVPGEATDIPRQLPPPEASDWEDVKIVGYSPCEQLVHHVCGQQNQCATAEACNASRQLLTMEQGERTRADDGSRMTYTSGQCLQAKEDYSYFAACRAEK